MTLEKLRLLPLLLIFRCMIFIRLTYLSFEEIDQMVSALAGDYMPTIVLDVGHGGEDGGTVSKSGVVEKNINPTTAVDLKPMLEISGFRVIMIRDSDISIRDNTSNTVKARKTSGMHNRLKIIKKSGGYMFLNIHQNHFINGKYSGAQIFYGTKNPKSQALTDTTQEMISTLLQPDNQRETKPATNSIYLLRNAGVPAVIIECGFLFNAGEAKKLNQSEYQKQVVSAIYQDFLSYWISISQTMA